jgi:hypothetical protein
MGTNLLQLVLDYYCCSNLSHHNELHASAKHGEHMALTQPWYEWYQIVVMVGVRVFAKALQDDNLKVYFAEWIVCSNCALFSYLWYLFCKQLKAAMLPWWNK